MYYYFKNLQFHQIPNFLKTKTSKTFQQDTALNYHNALVIARVSKDFIP